MTVPIWLKGSSSGYGRYFTGRGGMVTIKSRDGVRRVSVKPAFDPAATSMTPIAGWTAAGSNLAMAA